MNIKNQTWCGHDIRFVEKDGDWYAVLKDVCDALDLKAKEVSRQLREYQERRNKKGVGSTHIPYSDDKTTQIKGIGTTHTLSKSKKFLDKASIPTAGGTQEMLVVSEKGIYRTLFHSRKKEAEDFQDWVCDVLVELRQASELESYEAFRMTDKEIQKAANDRLYKTTHPESRVPVIKANTIANYATSKKHGQSKTLKKGEMTREMLEDRQAIYDDTINLMIAQKAFDLDISISKLVYKKYLGKE